MRNDHDMLLAAYVKGSSGGSAMLNIFKRRRPGSQPSCLNVSQAVLHILDEVFATCVYVVQKARPHPHSENAANDINAGRMIVGAGG